MVLTLALVGHVLAAQDLERLFKAAVNTETVDRNCKAAIEQYKKVAAGSNRSLAAQALLRMADCHRQLGDAEARNIYRRLTSDFSDQVEVARIAGERLAGAPAPEGLAREGTRKLWSTEELDSFGSVSSDGRYLTFTDWATDGDLALRDLSTGTTRHLTNTARKTGEFAEFSAISPDGRQVAYTWCSSRNQRCELRTLSVVSNSEPTVLRRSDDVAWMQLAGWTHDGRRLVVMRGLGNRGDISVIGIQDQSLRTVKTFERDLPDRVAVSPDDRYLAYDARMTADRADRDIFLIALDGSNEAAVVADAADDHLPLWAPDGRLLFLSDRTPTVSLWSLPVAGGRPAGPASMVKANLGTVQSIGMTRSGSFVYWLSSAERNVYVASLGNAGALAAPRTPMSQRFVNSNSGPAWSAGGASLAYYSTGPRAGLVIREMSTGRERDVPFWQLSVVNGPGVAPKWFPDGRRTLIVSRVPQRDALEFRSFDTQTGESQLLTRTVATGVGVNNPDLSPDGRTIVYVDRAEADSEGLRLLRFDIDTGVTTPLKEGLGRAQAVAISPDGSRVAWISAAASGPRIARVEVMSLSGGESRIVTAAQAVDVIKMTSLAWSPDSEYLYLAGTIGSGQDALFRVRAGGGALERTDVVVRDGFGAIRVHPDGSRIAYTHVARGEPAIWAIDNFLPPVK
jgi:Tol biopolymer transport system component